MKKKTKRHSSSESSQPSRDSQAGAPSQENLKAHLVKLREHLIRLAEGEQQNDGRVIWFDADFLVSIESSKARKWTSVKKILTEPGTLVIGAVSFGETSKSEVEFDLQFWVGPSANSNVVHHETESLATAIRVAEPYANGCVLITDNLEISILAQSHGMLVVHAEHARKFLELEYQKQSEATTFSGN